jgi:hypothetical protein
MAAASADSSSPRIQAAPPDLPISGFGGDYDNACEQVLKAGRERRHELIRRFWEREHALRKEAIVNL